MKTILSERNIVVVLFVMVLITFSLAQEDSKKMEKAFTGVQQHNARQLLVQQATPAEKPTTFLR
ncbi:MAG TPA: hypothetical protein VFV31_15520 [Chitinophagaceae bacterium]|nr:hypothetical protein [Chitinophagaceae bacterium]